DAYYQRKPTRCAGRQFAGSKADVSNIPGFKVLRRIFGQSECVRMSWVRERAFVRRSDCSSGAQTVNSKREGYSATARAKRDNQLPVRNKWTRYTISDTDPDARATL